MTTKEMTMSMKVVLRRDEENEARAIARCYSLLFIQINTWQLQKLKFDEIKMV